MSNMMPGDNSGAEPGEHQRDCPSLCEFADAPLAEGDECLEGHSYHDCDCAEYEDPQWDIDADRAYDEAFRD